MQDTLYFFRLREDGGITITTDRSGSRLPIDERLDYKSSDWKFLEAVPSFDLPRMITSGHEVEPALMNHGYYSLTTSQLIRAHPFWQRHKP